MADYTELVKFLRGLSPWAFPEASNKRMQEAADAIEALQAEQKKTVTQIFCEEQMAWEGRCKDLMKYISDLQAEIRESMQKCAECGDEQEQKVKELAKRNAELHAELQKWVSAAEKAWEPKREEVWKDVIGYEGLYQVSNQARVRNSKGQILKQCVKVGKCVYYKYVQLYKDGRYKMKYVHRIMAECFLPNPNNLPIINHKDEDGTNNRLDNLEWCTVEYNSNYGNAKRNMSRGKRRRAKMEVQE